MALDPATNFDGLANDLGLHEVENEPEPSTYWGHLEGDDLGAAVIDRFTRFREWLSANGLLKGWKLKQHYYYNEYRTDPSIPHLSLMEQWGSQGEYQFVSVNNLRSLLKTLLSSVVQNPPQFQPKAINADADALEAAALYQGVLDFYSRELRLTQKINHAVETGLVVDAGYILVEWDAFASDGDTPDPANIWRGAPSVSVLNGWDVAFDITKSSFSDLDWIVVRSFVDKQKLLSQFPEFADDIKGCRLRGEINTAGAADMEANGRYDLTSFSDMSNDIQVFKLFHRSQPWLQDGRFAMFLETGKMIFESPGGLMYPKLPVERFVCDECIDVLLGYSPINELLGLQENVNSLVSSITSNANNYANQYVACQQGTQINPRTLADGQKIIEFPPGAPPPTGINLTAIPETLFAHLKDLQDLMQRVCSVSNSSRAQTGGANQTGSAMLFLASQTSQNQGSMSDNYAQFASSVMTSLLHVLRTFARTQKTVNIMGKTVASKTIVLAEALKDFDEVVVDMQNPIMATPQGRMGFASQMMQFGNASAEQALEVAVSGNIGPVADPVREMLYELNSENEWLLDGESVLVNAMDNHEEHVKAHSRLFSTPWLRKPQLAEKLGIQNAPAIMQAIQAHIQQHMGFLANNQTAQTATTAGQQPGQQQTQPSQALGHAPLPEGSPAVGMGNPAQAGPGMLPNPPAMPKMPGQTPS